MEYAPHARYPTTSVVLTGIRRELLIAACAIYLLFLSQLMLSAAIHDSNYYGNDGKLYESIILTAFRFGGFFNVTNINPLQGVGSQLLPLNVWANPGYWPFAFFSREIAADVSAAVSLAIFMTGCYVMARCFDVSIVASSIAAQFCIVLFAPTALLFNTPSNFVLCPGNALVHSLHMVALGILARLEPGSPRRFFAVTGALLLVFLYSVYADPLWTMFSGATWAVPFAVVTFGSWNRQAILIRCAALGCCFLVLLVSGALEYLYALSQYTARVQFADVLDRVRGPGLVSSLSFSLYMKTFYLACFVGWLLGLLTLRGRSRLLVIAAAVSAGFLIVYSVIYLLLENAKWLVAPDPAVRRAQLLCAVHDGRCCRLLGAPAAHDFLHCEACRLGFRQRPDAMASCHFRCI